MTTAKSGYEAHRVIKELMEGNLIQFNLDREAETFRFVCYYPWQGYSASFVECLYTGVSSFERGIPSMASKRMIIERYEVHESPGQHPIQHIHIRGVKRRPGRSVMKFEMTNLSTVSFEFEDVKLRVRNCRHEMKSGKCFYFDVDTGAPVDAEFPFDDVPPLTP